MICFTFGRFYCLACFLILSGATVCSRSRAWVSLILVFLTTDSFMFLFLRFSRSLFVSFDRICLCLLLVSEALLSRDVSDLFLSVLRWESFLFCFFFNISFFLCSVIWKIRAWLPKILPLSLTFSLSCYSSSLGLEFTSLLWFSSLMTRVISRRVFSNILSTTPWVSSESSPIWTFKFNCIPLEIKDSLKQLSRNVVCIECLIWVSAT